MKSLGKYILSILLLLIGIIFGIWSSIFGFLINMPIQVAIRRYQYRTKKVKMNIIGVLLVSFIDALFRIPLKWSNYCFSNATELARTVK